MDNSLYGKNVMKTFSNKPAQHGLRRVAGNKIRTHLMHAGFGLANEMSEFIEVIQPYLEGATAWRDEFLASAKDELGDVGYFMRVIAKYTVAKLPTSTKKSHLDGTPTHAILRMNAIAAKIAGLQKKNFYGPIMKEVDGKQVIDLVATKTVEASRLEKTKALLEEFIPLYWGLTSTLLKTTPSELFDMNIAKLAVRYPDGFFDAGAESSKDPAKESAAQALKA